MEDEQIQKHLVKNSDRLETWPKMFDEIRDMLRTESYLNSTPAPMQIGATPKCKGKGRDKDWKKEEKEKRKQQEAQKRKKEEEETGRKE